MLPTISGDGYSLSSRSSITSSSSGLSRSAATAFVGRPPDVLLAALTGRDANRRCFVAQVYVGLSLPAAKKRAGSYYGQED